MNRYHPIADDWDVSLESLAAELAEAAYPIALRHGVKGSWIDLELDLWKALTHTVKKWGQQPPRPDKWLEATG